MINIPDWSTLPDKLKARLLEDLDLLCPRPQDTFRAFELNPVENTKVVILGQDPYHTPSKASGLAFGYHKDYKGRIDSSLLNILNEVESDTGRRPKDISLESWARQGVLLLNTRLSVLQGSPMSHAGIGWEKVVTEFLTDLDSNIKNKVYLLWGREAQGYAKYLDHENNLILETSHPCRFSVHRGFAGCAHFSTANEYLNKHNKEMISW